MKPIVIAAIGEVLWDVYPDAAHSDAAHFGGAPANFVCHAARLGAEAWMVSAVGQDSLGDEALVKLQRCSVQCGHVTRDGRHDTGRVLVRLDSKGEPSYEFASDPAWDHIAWSDDLAALAARCDAVCFGTLAQRSPISRETIRRFVQRTPRAALRVFDVNLRQRFYDADILKTSLDLASAVKLNEEELPVVAQLGGLRSTEPGAQLKELLRRHELTFAALTRGAAGSWVVTDGREHECPAAPVNVVDTVGAGDAFTAALVIGFLRGQPLATVHQHASAVASYVCSQRGATPELPSDLLNASL